MTPTTEALIAAYAPDLHFSDLPVVEHRDEDDKAFRLPLAEVQIFANKFARGGEAADGVLGLGEMLLERWQGDCHFSAYTSNPGMRCVKADASSYSLTFGAVAVDLDFDNHRQLPTRADFADLLRVFHVLEFPAPNVMYETRGGARAIWLIEAIHDADEYEGHVATLLTKLGELIARSSMAYRVDTQAKDWTRLFRCPLVVRDGVAEYGRKVVVMTDAVLDLTTFRRRRKRVRTVVAGGQAYQRNDLKLLHLLHTDMDEGGRNVATFKALCHTYRTYEATAAAQWVETIRAAALNAGLPEAEFESALRSAQKQSIKVNA